VSERDLRDLADRFDARVERAIDRVRSPALDRVAYGLGAAADHSLLWHAIGAVRAARAGSARPAVRLSSALAIESLLTNVVVKSLFRRVRPERPVSVEADARLPFGMRVPITSSFPSGHAGAAFAAAAILSEDGDAPFWYAFATAVAASRVYVRMHHATDVLAGAALGSALGHALRRVLPK
jgi:undecaprenyl-diphosphatase